MNLTIQREGQAPREIQVDRQDVRLGKHSECEVVLDDPKVSRRHARLTVEGDTVFVEDLGSTNGTSLAGRPITGRVELPPGAPLAIGPYVIRLSGLAKATSDKTTITVAPVASATAAPPPAAPPPAAEADDATLPPPPATQTIPAKPPVSPGLELGPLAALFADERVSEVMVNGPNEVFCERGGKLQLADARFDSEKTLVDLIRAMAADVGREIDPRVPMLDARLRDGSRLNAILPPLALRGPCLTIRRFPQSRFSAEQLISIGAMSTPMFEFLSAAVKGRLSMLISGGTGSGKTTLLSALCAFIGSDERIITIEDAAELRLPQRHVVPLEAKPPDPDGKGMVTIRDLVRNALRMRPERIVVGEVRGGEALDMLQAMNTGHEGSLSTIHANSPREAIQRLETLVLFAGTELPQRAIREQVVSAIRLIVQTSRLRDGSRRVTSVAELTGLEGDQFTMGEVFRLEGTGKDAVFKATGYVPKSREVLVDRKIPVDNKWFQP